MPAQTDVDSMSNFDSFHRMTQIESTEKQLRDYFSNISNQNDILYVILCPLMYCPRCEGMIVSVQDLLYQAVADNFMVFIASYPAKEAAAKYVESRYEFQDVIFDTDESFLSFLVFRTRHPRIPILMKVGRKAGRLLVGGYPNDINYEFVDALVCLDTPMPYYSELWNS